MFKKKDKTYHSYWSISWNIFKKNKVAMACLGIVIILCLVALFAPWIAPYDPDAQVLTERLMPPSAQHWFGTMIWVEIFFQELYMVAVFP